MFLLSDLACSTAAGRYILSPLPASKRGFSSWGCPNCALDPNQQGNMPGNQQVQHKNDDLKRQQSQGNDGSLERHCRH